VLPAATAGRADIVQNQTTAAVLAHWLALMAGEFAFGCVLGLGVRILFSALQLAGELVDQQAGLAMQQVFNPAVDGESGPIAAAFVWLGLGVFFTASPAGGDLMLVEAMLQQFATIPVGTGLASAIDTRLPIVLVQEAASLAFRVAGPMLGAMSLISMASAWLGRTAPRLQVGPLVAPVRIVVSLALLTAALPGLVDVFAETFGVILKSAARY
jgi:flagellar biosynthetic protein FliR